MSDVAAGVASGDSSGGGAQAPIRAVTTPAAKMVLEILDRFMDWALLLFTRRRF
jgi:hypothetical protein